MVVHVYFILFFPGYEEETSIRKTTVESQYSSKVWKSSEVKTLIDLHMKKEYRFNKPGSKKKKQYGEKYLMKSTSLAIPLHILNASRNGRILPKLFVIQ